MFRIYLVCTGNRCRSPIAEAALRQLAHDLPVEVGSAGLLELGPVPVPPELVEIAASMGLDVASHRARRFSREDIRSADLILGLERAHVAATIVDGGAPRDKAFTLREFVRLVEETNLPDHQDPEVRARAVVAAAHETRHQGGEFVPGENIEDPFGGPRRAYLGMTVEVRALCRRLIEGLFGRAATPRPPLTD